MGKYCRKYQNRTCIYQKYNINHILHIMAKKINSNFLYKLFQLLEESSQEQVICWNQEENGFIVYNSEMLVKHILPKYFKHQKLTSFIRQLNMYSFQKLYKSNCQFAYYHKNFTKNQVQNLKKIKRKKEPTKSFDALQSDTSQDLYQQYALLQKRQKNLYDICLKSIQKTSAQLAKSQIQTTDVIQDHQKRRKEFIQEVKREMQKENIIDQHQVSNVDDQQWSNGHLELKQYDCIQNIETGAQTYKINEFKKGKNTQKSAELLNAIQNNLKKPALVDLGDFQVSMYFSSD